MGLLGSSSSWKREAITEHKFDFIDVAEFYDGSFLRLAQYMLVFVILIKSILVYVADFWTAYLLITGSWTNGIRPAIPVQYSKWIFVACISISYLLLLWELRKARRIVRSRDIAYAFTNIAASRYYSVLSYAHFCLFQRIDRSTSLTEGIAFFIFFRLKGWKRILLAEAPRQVINGFTMWAIFADYRYDLGRAVRHEQYTEITRQIAFGLMAFTFVMFALSAVALLIAFVLYIPLLCQIRGNLKEYVCHLVDKRIEELLRKNKHKRMAAHQKWMAKRAGSEVGSTAKATLPKVGDAMDDQRSMYKGGYADSVISGPVYGGYYGKAPPPVPPTPQQYTRSTRPGTPESVASGYASSGQRTYVSGQPDHHPQYSSRAAIPPPVPALPSGYAASNVSYAPSAAAYRALPAPPQRTSPTQHNPLLAQYREQQQAGVLRAGTYRPPQHQAPPQLDFDQSSDAGSVMPGPQIFPEDSISEVGARSDAGYAPGPNVRTAARGRYVPPAGSEDGGSIIMAGQPAPRYARNQW